MISIPFTNEFADYLASRWPIERLADQSRPWQNDLADLGWSRDQIDEVTRRELFEDAARRFSGAGGT